MKKFLDVLNTNEYPILVINLFSKDDIIMLTDFKFKVYDYYIEEEYIRLTTKDGTEFVLPKNLKYSGEDLDSWIVKYNDIEIFIYFE